jgi:hypothetical protein
LDAQRRETKKKLAAAVKASGTSLTSKVFGVGPVVAATVIGDTGRVSRFPSRDHFAAYNGTAPAEVSSGNRKIYRLSLKGNRSLKHAIHMAAVTQIRHTHSDGRAYYQTKIAEGKTPKEALRALKRRISDAIHAALVADDRQIAAVPKGPGGQPGNLSVSRAAGSHPAHRLFGQATPGPHPTLRPVAGLTSRAQLTGPGSTQPGPAGWPAASSQLPVPRAGRAGVKRERPAGRTTLTPGRPAGHSPSEKAEGGMRALRHRAAPPMPATAAGGSSRTTPVKNRRPKTISKKPPETP